MRDFFHLVKWHITSAQLNFYGHETLSTVCDILFEEWFFCDEFTFNVYEWTFSLDLHICVCVCGVFYRVGLFNYKFNWAIG